MDEPRIVNFHMSKRKSTNIDLAQLRKIAESRGGKCLTKKLNEDGKWQRLEWECAKGHRWKASRNSVVHGRWCPSCAIGSTAVQASRRFRYERQKLKPNTIESVAVDNYRGFQGEAKLKFAPITVLFGPNSGGKSSLLNALSVLVQNVGSENLNPSGVLVDFGSPFRMFNEIDKPLEYKLKHKDSPSVVSLKFGTESGGEGSAKLNAIGISYPEFGFTAELNPIENTQDVLSILMGVANDDLTPEQGAAALNRESLIFNSPFKSALNRGKVSKIPFPPLADRTRARLYQPDEQDGALFGVSTLTENEEFWSYAHKIASTVIAGEKLTAYDMLHAAMPMYRNLIEDAAEHYTESIAENYRVQEQGEQWEIAKTRCMDCVRQESFFDELDQDDQRELFEEAGADPEFIEFKKKLNVECDSQLTSVKSAVLKIKAFITEFSTMLNNHDSEALKIIARSELVYMQGHTAKSICRFCEPSRGLCEAVEQSFSLEELQGDKVDNESDSPRMLLYDFIAEGSKNLFSPAQILKRYTGHLVKLSKQMKPISAHRSAAEHLVTTTDYSQNLSTGKFGEHTSLLLAEDNKLVDSVNKKLKKLEAGFWIKPVKLPKAAVRALGRDRTAITAVVSDVSGDKDVPIDDLGTGHRILLSLLIDLQLKDAMLLVEEPESHLHPALQAEIAQEFAFAWKENNTTSLVETHSIAFFYRLQKMVKEKKFGLKPDDISLNYIDCHSDQPILNIRIDEFGEFMERPPAGFFDRDLLELD